MYTVAMFVFAKATGLSFFHCHSGSFCTWLAAWGVTYIGMVPELASLFAPQRKRNNAAVLSNARHEREYGDDASCENRQGNLKQVWRCNERSD
jgi:hypothetical protein